MQVEGHGAIVTGGGSGLGAATAAALARAGAQVAVLDLDAKAADAVAGRIGAIALPCDVADAGSAAAAVAAAQSRHGPARVLVNCAGIAPIGRTVGRNGPLDLEAFRKVIEVNLVGTFNMIRLVAEALREAQPLEDGERGVVVSTASIAAFEGQIGQVAYAASKAGVAGMTLPIARDLASLGIRACTIAPGLFETPMLRGLPEEVHAGLGASVPFPSRLGRPEEYAELALHIVTNRMLNGEVIRLDGALRMPPK